MGAEKLLIFDEPLASLDPKRRETFMDYIEATEKRIGIPVLYITHSEHETERLASRLLYIEDGVIRENLATPPASTTIPTFGGLSNET